MKKFYLAILLILGILVIGCADNVKSPVDAFRGRSEQQIFTSGKNALIKKHYDDAIKSFEALEALYPFSEYTEQAQLDVIYAYFITDDLDSAIAAATRYIHLYPNSEHTDYAYYLGGVASFNKNISWVDRIYTSDPSLRDASGLREAFVDFNAIVTQFPQSKYAADAERRMVYIRNVMADQELVVAQFYLKRKAYVAAANRAAYIVQHFQNSSQVKDALVVMLKSYQALGATKEVDDTLKIIQSNYPGFKVKK